MLHMINEFRLPVALDFAPEKSVCEWCGKPAVHEITVIGGPRHNDGGYFCEKCAEEYVREVASEMRTSEIKEEEIPQ